MKAVLEWSGRPETVACRMCGTVAECSAVVSFSDHRGFAHTARRCPGCGSLSILDGAPFDSSPGDVAVDSYLEHGAGVGTIVNELMRVAPSGVSRFLDVGCNFGYALDFARHAFGWSVLGVEPSHAGVRGATELGLDIRNEYLTNESDFGTFDLILSSEVLEHVTDPAQFITTLVAHLSDGGTLILTTPAAEVVNQQSASIDVWAALSPGYHVFIASEKGLRDLLRNCGLTSIEIRREGVSFRASGVRGERRPQSNTVVHSDGVAELESYLAWRASESPEGSALSLGMQVRLLRSFVARGAIAEASDQSALVRAEFLARFGFDPEETAASESIFEGRPLAAAVTLSAGFALGMLRLLVGDHRQAVDDFDLAVVAATVRRRTIGDDPDSVDLTYQSQFHRLLALTRFSPRAVAGETRQLEAAARAAGPAALASLSMRHARLFVELVHQDPEGDHSALERIVAPVALPLAFDRDPEKRIAGMDALYSLGESARRRGDMASAAALFDSAIAACEAARGTGVERDVTHAVALMTLCAARRDSIPPHVPPSEPSSVESGIDAYSCDSHGTYIEGWATVDGRPAHAVTIRGSGLPVVAERLVRMPGLVTPSSEIGASFRAWLPGHPTPLMQWTVSAGEHERVITVSAPEGPRPVVPGQPTLQDAQSRIRDLVLSAPEGPVLALGVRSSGPDGAARVRALFPGRVVVGVDIHPGFGVDIVADAHRLGEALDGRKFAIVYSASLLEHVAVPWIVARECALALVDGGITIHHAPWLWPTHAQPNDFWRFSPEGLEQLFSSALGLEVLASGGYSGSRAVPELDWRSQSPLHSGTTSPAMAWICSRRFGSPSEHTSWPYDEVRGRDIARAYPVEGIMPADTSAPSPRPKEQE